jgi:hypothetical protein
MHLRCQCQCANAKEPTRDFWGDILPQKSQGLSNCYFDRTLTLVVVRMAGLRGWQTSCRLGSRQFGLALRQPSGCRWCQNLRPPVYRHNESSGPCNLPRFDRQPHLIRKREKNDRLLPPNCPRLVFRTATFLGDFNGTLQGHQRYLSAQAYPHCSRAFLPYGCLQ